MKLVSLAILAMVLLLLALVTGQAWAQTAMTFRLAANGGNCNGCEWIVADGVITSNTPSTFRRFVMTMPGGISMDVALNSPGGNVSAAMELGRLIRERAYTTSVARTVPEDQWSKTIAGECNSACALAFLGGVQRVYSPDLGTPEGGSRLGFHQFTASADARLNQVATLIEAMGIGLRTAQVLTGFMIAYTVDMGVDPRVITRASTITPERLWVLTASEAEQMKVTTRLSDQPEWRLETMRGGLLMTGIGDIYPTGNFHVGLSCHPTQQNSLMLTVAVSGPNLASWGVSQLASLNSAAVLQGRPLQPQGAPPFTLARTPYRLVGERVLVGVLLDGRAINFIRTVGLDIEYAGPRVYSNVFPQLSLTMRDVGSAVDLLRRNCPAP